LELSTLRRWNLQGMQIWSWVHFEGEIFKECKFGAEYTLKVESSWNANLELRPLWRWNLHVMQIWNWVHFEGEVFKECKFGTESTLKVESSKNANGSVSTFEGGNVKEKCTVSHSF
jgi:hypothetical protein